jgi:hypothetical protein
VVTPDVGTITSFSEVAIVKVIKSENKVSGFQKKILFSVHPESLELEGAPIVGG